MEMVAWAAFIKAFVIALLGGGGIAYARYRARPLDDSGLEGEIIEGEWTSDSTPEISPPPKRIARGSETIGTGD